MKKILGVLIMSLSMSAFAGEVNVKVSGMVCSMCAQGIQKKFSGQEAIEKLHVDMDAKEVHIKTKEGKDISDETIKTLITEAGYNVAAITRK